MKCIQLLLGVFSYVLSVYTADNSGTIKLNTIRAKREENEAWIWGYETVNNSDSNNPDARLLGNPNTGARIEKNPNTRESLKEITTNKTAENEEEDPCLRKNPTMPDFRAPGRRMSDIKCYEYIWQIKYREVVQYNELKCNEKKYNVSYAIGGRLALPGEFPHMGAIGWRSVQGTWIFKCGCSLISSKFVLTAAHCSKASPLDTTINGIVPKIVRLGDINIIVAGKSKSINPDQRPEDANILRIIVHPQYSPPRKYFDIALMELEREVNFGWHIQPACLWGKFDTNSLGTNATLTGWGVVETAGRTTSPDLQAAVVDIIDSERCDALLRPSCNRHWCGIEDHQICAGKLAGGVDACQGDSGGPLQVGVPLPTSTSVFRKMAGPDTMYYVIGVTSFGFGCALADTPGVYTRVSSFVDWIEKIVWQ